MASVGYFETLHKNRLHPGRMRLETFSFPLSSISNGFRHAMDGKLVGLGLLACVFVIDAEIFSFRQIELMWCNHYDMGLGWVGAFSGPILLINLIHGLDLLLG